MMVGERLAEAFHAGGVPADVFQNVVLDHATTEHLIAGRYFNFVNFTGSVAGGAAMERAAAGTFTPLGLELGGKDPGYVRADANLDAAVDTLMDGAMFNSGQCCCGIERIYVHESLFDAFVEKSVAWVNGMKLGSPLDPETTLGPMANKRFAKVVRDQIAEAVAAPRAAPSSIPRVIQTKIGQRTAPLRWCSSSELIEVKTMVASEVPTARWVRISAGMPCAAKLKTSTGTMINPPPTPNSPASTPAQAPNSR